MAIRLAVVLALVGVAVFYGLMRLIRGPALASTAAKRFAVIWIPLHVLVAVIAVLGGSD